MYIYIYIYISNQHIITYNNNYIPTLESRTPSSYYTTIDNTTDNNKTTTTNNDNTNRSNSNSNNHTASNKDTFEFLALPHLQKIACPSVGAELLLP